MDKHVDVAVATAADWEAIRAIYAAGIETGEATFNTVDDIPAGEVWFAGKLAGLTLKAVDSHTQKMLGWATLSAVSKRRVYRGIAEVSVYVAADAQGRGVGSRLLAQLLTAAQQAGIWTIEARIFPTNHASLRLHEKFGFVRLGTHQRRAQQYGVWRDVVSMEWRSDDEPFPIALATRDQFTAVRELLQACDLPTADLVPAAMDRFLVCGAAGQVDGCIGFERYGNSALLRSLAVAPAMQGNKLGSRLIDCLEAFVRGRGIEQLWLLTTTAESFFARRGYVGAARESAPEAMQGAAEFADLCPSTAHCMRKMLY